MAVATPHEILEATQRLLDATPITLTALIEALEASGLELGPNARAEVIRAIQQRATYLELDHDRWFALDRALEGTTWATVADAEPAAIDCLAATPDLELVHWCAIDRGIPLRERGTDHAGLVTAEDLDDGSDALGGPAGWLAEHAGATIAVAMRDGRCSIEPLDALPEAADELAQLVRSCFDEHATRGELRVDRAAEPTEVVWMFVEELLCEAIAADRGLFTAGVVPRIDAVLELAALQRRDDRVIDASASWDELDRLLDRNDLARTWDLDDDEVEEAEMLIAASYGVMDGVLDLDAFGDDDRPITTTDADGTPLIGAAAASFILALCVLHDPVARAFIGHHLEHETDPAELAGFARELLEHVDPPADTGLRWLLAWTLDQQGDALAAEAELERALRDGVDFVPALRELAGFRSDRGDAPGAMELLERAVRRELGDLDDPEAVDVDRDVELLLDEVEDYARNRPVAPVGRNDPCPCGSGRKYKACHLGTERHPLVERGPWLYEKARRFLHTRPTHVILTRLAALATDAADGDTAMFVSLHDVPLLADVALHEAGVFADFVRERDALLPDDEALTAAQWALTDRSLFEILEIGGHDVAMRDLRTGEELTVTNVTPSAQSHVGSLLLGRPLPIADTWRALSGFVDVLAEHREAALELLTDDPDPFDLATFVGQCLARGETESPPT